MVVLVLAIAGCWSGPAQQYKAAKATRMTNPLAIRLSNYGQFQEAAWTHLPLICSMCSSMFPSPKNWR